MSPIHRFRLIRSYIMANLQHKIKIKSIRLESLCFESPSLERITDFIQSHKQIRRVAMTDCNLDNQREA